MACDLGFLSLSVAALLAQSIDIERERLEVLTQVLAMKIWIVVGWHVGLVSATPTGHAGDDPMRESRILPNVAFAIFAATDAHRSNENKMSDGWRERAWLRVEGGVSF